MEFVDVVFPLKLGPLTYEVPKDLKGAVRPGMLVEAEVKRTLKRGVVLKPRLSPPGGRIKPIEGLAGDAPVLSNHMLSLITWMSEYYFSNEGEVLKSIFPREFFHGVRARGSRKKDEPERLEARMPASPYGLDDKAREAIDEMRGNIRKRYYKTWLHHAPTTDYELLFLLEALEGTRNVMVLAPDLERVRQVYRLLEGRFGERAVLYHSGMSRGRRSGALERIASGRADIVVGSRSAVFAPLREVSLIAVTQEESTAYKEERGVRYNARDIAVMRGYLEGATVLLSSVCPSVESFHNAEKGKYVMLRSAPQHMYPLVRVMRKRGLEPISKKVREAVEARIKKDERVMFVVNRLGYSMLRCGECGHMEACPGCDIPLVYYKAEKALRCNYCGRGAPLPERCPRCGGAGLGPSGAGIERVEEELKALHPVEVTGRRGSALKVLMDDSSRLVVGTKLLARRAGVDHPFSIAAVLNADSYLYMPDFRSTERAFQELVYTAGKVRPGGHLIVQTRNPRAPLFRYLRRFDFGRFYRDELGAREALGYPPFKKIVLITFEAGGEPAVRVARGVEVLGPVQSVSKRGKKVWKVLLKSGDRKALRLAVLDITRRHGGRKASVDVDPVRV
jgi:primosomal protein N' (replication factor Y)